MAPFSTNFFTYKYVAYLGVFLPTKLLYMNPLKLFLASQPTSFCLVVRGVANPKDCYKFTTYEDFQPGPDGSWPRLGKINRTAWRRPRLKVSWMTMILSSLTKSLASAEKRFVESRNSGNLPTAAKFEPIQRSMSLLSFKVLTIVGRPLQAESETVPEPSRPKVNVESTDIYHGQIAVVCLRFLGVFAMSTISKLRPGSTQCW